MPKRHRDLFGGIASFPALHAAARCAIRGKRAKPGAAAFMARLEAELLRLERSLQAGIWRPGRYVEIAIRDPKPRLVSAAPFPDRVVHHALCAVIGPIFEQGFIHDSYANRLGKGTHRAVARYERCRDRFRHVLRCDIYRYFPAIDHVILKQDLRRRIACQRTLWLTDTIIDGSNPQEPVNLYYPGDDLLTPFERRRGLPIGNLTSQLFANIHLDGLDHFVKEVLRAKGYLRYVDDFALFHDDAGQLAAWRERIGAYLAQRRLSLHPHKTGIQPCAEPAEFLGFVLLPDGRRRLPEDNVRRFRNRLRGLRDRWRGAPWDWRRSSGGWGPGSPMRSTLTPGACGKPSSGADCSIRPDNLFEAGMAADAVPGHRGLAGPLSAGACCAAVRGTTNPPTYARPTATGTTRRTGTTTPVSAPPVHPIAGAAPSTAGAGVRGCVQDRP
jgi:RNA-directed DNA polymerase